MTKIAAAVKTDPWANYNKMAREAIEARKARKARMVANGCTPDAADYIIDREIVKRRGIEEARRFCRCNNRFAGATIGEILAAKMAMQKEV